jgi:hypothetical protein
MLFKLAYALKCHKTNFSDKLPDTRGKACFGPVCRYEMQQIFKKGICRRKTMKEKIMTGSKTGYLPAASIWRADHTGQPAKNCRD